MRKMLSEVALKLKEVASPCCLALWSVMKKVLLAAFTCILAIGKIVDLVFICFFSSVLLFILEFDSRATG